MKRITNPPKNITNTRFYVLLAFRVIDINIKYSELLLEKPNSHILPFEQLGSDSEKHFKRIYNRFSSLDDQLNLLFELPKYIHLKGIVGFLKKNSITEIDYYQYTYENYLIRLASTIDLCAKLGNEIYRTKLTSRQCNWYKFSNHPKVKGLESSKIIFEFSEALSSKIQERHTIVHSGQFKSGLIESIQSKIISNKIVPMKRLASNWFRSKKKEEVSKLTMEMNTSTSLAFEYSRKFVISLTKELKILLEE